MRKLLFFFSILITVYTFCGEIYLKPEVIINRNQVYLSDLVRNTKLNGNEIKGYEYASKFSLVYLSSYEKEKVLTLSFIKRFLSSRNLTSIKVYGPQKITVKRKVYEITPSKIRLKIRLYLEQKLSLDPETEIELITNLRNGFYLNEKPEEWNFKIINGTMKNRKILQLVILGENEKVLKRINLTVLLKLYKNIWVASRDIKRGEIISEDYIKQAKVDIYSIKREYYKSLKNIIGKTAKINIKEGSLFTTRNIWQPPAIKRGEVINIIAENEFIKVTAKGKALKDGKIGETILVENLSSHRRIAAKVINDNTVKVPF